MTKKTFKDFVNEGKPAKVENLDEVMIPTNVIADPEDEKLIPALFATIHFQSEDRPNGYTPEDIEDMNNAANAHLPHLQTDRARLKDNDQTSEPDEEK